MTGKSKTAKDDGCCGGGVGPIPYLLCTDCPRVCVSLATVKAALTVSDATIRLHAGEMTAQEMRTVQAVLKWKLAELEHIARTGTPLPADKG